MTRIGLMNVNIGNNKYQFVVYDLNGQEYSAPGVYILQRAPNAQGETITNFCTLVKQMG